MNITRQQLAALPPDDLRAVAEMANDLVRQREEAERAQLWEDAMTSLQLYAKVAGKVTIRPYGDCDFSIERFHSGGVGVIEEEDPYDE